MYQVSLPGDLLDSLKYVALNTAQNKHVINLLVCQKILKCNFNVISRPLPMYVQNKGISKCIHFTIFSFIKYF